MSEAGWETRIRFVHLAYTLPRLAGFLLRPVLFVFFGVQDCLYGLCVGFLESNYRLISRRISFARLLAIGWGKGFGKHRIRIFGPAGIGTRGHAALSWAQNLISADGWLVHGLGFSFSVFHLATAPLPFYLIASSSTGSATCQDDIGPSPLHHSVLDTRPDILFNILFSPGLLTAVKVFSHSLGAAFPPCLPLLFSFFSFPFRVLLDNMGKPFSDGEWVLPVVYCLVVEGTREGYRNGVDGHHLAALREWDGSTAQD